MPSDCLFISIVSASLYQFLERPLPARRQRALLRQLSQGATLPVEVHKVGNHQAVNEGSDSDPQSTARVDMGSSPIAGVVKCVSGSSPPLARELAVRVLPAEDIFLNQLCSCGRTMHVVSYIDMIWNVVQISIPFVISGKIAQGSVTA